MPATGSSRTPGSSGRLSTGLSRTAKDRDEAVVRYRVEPAETVDRVRGCGTVRSRTRWVAPSGGLLSDDVEPSLGDALYVEVNYDGAAIIIVP
jgi:hypothetical protein